MSLFPALDPEPPPRSGRAVALLTVGVVVVLVLLGLVAWRVVAAGQGMPVAVPMTAAPRLDLPGRLVVFDVSTGRLGVARPDGGGFTPFAGAAFPANTAVASSDGRHVVIGGTRVVDVGPAGELVRPTPLSNGAEAAVPTPFADRGRRVVLSVTSPGSPGLLTVDLDGGTRHSLGGDPGGAVGDPAGDGAVVAVQGAVEVNVGPYVQRDTSRVELRVWGGATSTVATTAQLVSAAGLPTGSPYLVWSTVSPDGRLLALSVDELTANANSVTAKHAVVVTDRSGRVLTSRTSFIAARPAWSGDSTQLAYLDDQGVVLVGVTGGRAVTDSIPSQVRGGPCLFSPAGDRLLCDDRLTGERFIVTLADGHVDQLGYDPAHLTVAWLPATSGGGG